MERFVIVVNGFQLLTITKRSILDVAAVLDPPLDRKVHNFRVKNITNNNENIVWSKNTYQHVRFDRTKFQKGRIVDLEKFYQVVKKEIQ